MKTFKAMFQKVKGWDVLRQYARSGVLFFALVQTALTGFSKKSLELVRLAVNNKILRKLRRKYRTFCENFVASYTPGPQVQSNKVWICWLQGMDSAPPLVQRCYRSVQTHLKDREIILLTQDNYRDYVTFPEHIQKKIDSGIITKTHMSDLLRLELLLRYGGTWMDATVFCSGGNIPDYMLDSPLFLYQILKPGADGQPTVISSWFLTACTNHPILALTQAMLYRYWEEKNYLVDYFLLHDFFQLAMESYPQLWQEVVPASSSAPLILLLRLFDRYDETVWSAAVRQTSFHKLSYKLTQPENGITDTYYAHIMDGELGAS